MNTIIQGLGTFGAAVFWVSLIMLVLSFFGLQIRHKDLTIKDYRWVVGKRILASIGLMMLLGVAAAFLHVPFY